MRQTFSTRLLRISESLADSTQLAKSLRSSDVSLLHCPFAFGVSASALCRFIGTIAKQHGRRFPAASLLGILSIRRFLVSDCLAESIHVIKSLRASGVRSLHWAFAFGAAAKTSRRSAGTLTSGSSFFILLV